MIYYHFNIPTVGPFRCADTHLNYKGNAGEVAFRLNVYTNHLNLSPSWLELARNDAIVFLIVTGLLRILCKKLGFTSKNMFLLFISDFVIIIYL